MIRLTNSSCFLFLESTILGHSLTWYDASLHHLVHHSSTIAPGCNIYHSDIIVVTANVWIPEIISSSNSLCASSSPTCSTLPMGISTTNNHLAAAIIHSDDSENDDNDEENPNSTSLNTNHLQSIPSQWDMSINGNDFLPVYNHHHHHLHHHHQQQQQQTTIYDDDGCKQAKHPFH